MKKNNKNKIERERYTTISSMFIDEKTQINESSVHIMHDIRQLNVTRKHFID